MAAQVIDASGVPKDPQSVFGTGSFPVPTDTTDADRERNTVHAPKFKLPPGFADEQAFLRDAVTKYSDDTTADFLNTSAMVDDQRFVVGRQWDLETERRRIAAKKPVMTVNRLPAYVAQVIGNRLLNETVIKVIPDWNSTKEKARVRQGLIRGIEKKSKADQAYDTALQNSVIGGLGNFGLRAKYAAYNVFEQELEVYRLPDATAVVWDRLGIEPTGRDALHCFVEERISRKDFNRKYPWAQANALGGDTLYLNQLTATGWFSLDSVRICSYWRMRSEPCVIYLSDSTGKTIDVTGKPRESWIEDAAINPNTQQPYIRESERPFAECYLMSATDILAGPYRLNTSRLPVFRVPGWEIFVGEERHRFGLIRFAKDPQRIHNYWRSVIVEKLMQTPRSKWTATKEAVEGHEKSWRNSHLTDDPLLIWNGEAGQEPKQVQPAQIEAALIQEANMASQDIKDVLNMHEAALGMQSNEVSGKALDKRQRVAELGTVIYFSNLNNAIEECGRCINEVIPDFYDTARTITIIGEDGKADLQKINSDEPDSVNIVDGNYGISVVTGPSYATKRVEAVETMEALANSMPEVMAVAADLMVENMDLPGSEAIAKRLKAANPIAQQEQKPEDMSPEQQQKMAVQQQKADMAEQIQMATMAAELAELQNRAAKLQAETKRIIAQAETEVNKAALTEAQTRNTNADTQLKVAQTGKTEIDGEVSMQDSDVRTASAAHGMGRSDRDETRADRDQDRNDQQHQLDQHERLENNGRANRDQDRQDRVEDRNDRGDNRAAFETSRNDARAERVENRNDRTAQGAAAEQATNFITTQAEIGRADRGEDRADRAEDRADRESKQKPKAPKGK